MVEQRPLWSYLKTQSCREGCIIALSYTSCLLFSVKYVHCTQCVDGQLTASLRINVPLHRAEVVFLVPCKETLKLTIVYHLLLFSYLEQKRRAV